MDSTTERSAVVREHRRPQGREAQGNHPFENSLHLPADGTAKRVEMKKTLSKLFVLKQRLFYFNGVNSTPHTLR